MSASSLHFGQHVVSRDGHRVGRVDRILLDDENRNLQGFVVHRLLGVGDKIVEIGLVERIEGDTVTLSVDSAAAKELPSLLEQEYVEVSADQALHDTYQSLIPGSLGSFVASVPVAGRRTIAQTTAGLYDPAIPNGAVVTESSNLPIEDDQIRTGTEVVGADGKSVGKVHEIDFAGDGTVSGVIVKAGFLFHHDVRIPASAIAEIGSEKIHLNVPAGEAGHPTTA